MLVHRAHKIQLDPTCKQVEYFKQACGTSRFVWNWALAEWNKQYEAGQKPSAYSLKKQFNAIKYQEWPWLRAVHRDAHSQPFSTLQSAFQSFFKKKAKRPTFKKKEKCKDSFYVANDQFVVSGNRIRLPVIGWIRLTEDLRFNGKQQSAVVSRSADRWFVSVSVEVDLLETIHGPGAIGVDLGVSSSITCSDGKIYQSPKPLRSNLKKLKRLSRRHSKKKPNSANRTKLANKLAKLHLRIRNIRQDFLHKTTTSLLRKNHAIVIEDLCVAGMLHNRRLARVVADEGFREFRRQLEYKAPIFGAVVHVVDRFFPSSKMCSFCGQVKQKLKLSDRRFICDWCGCELDRDMNAALNLMNQLPKAIRKVKPVDRQEPQSNLEDGMKQELCGAHTCAQER